VEIKIGIVDVARELSIDAQVSGADEVVVDLQSALELPNGVLELTDDKGRRLAIPANRVAYLDFGVEHARQVGFGAFTEAKTT
jgi:hypothetical protein